VKRCSFPDCNRRHNARGYCTGHYQQLLAGKELTSLRARQQGCKFEGCEREHKGHGYCTAHMRQWRSGKPLRPIGVKSGRFYPCHVEGCERNAYQHRFCPTHRPWDGLPLKLFFPSAPLMDEIRYRNDGVIPGRVAKALGLCGKTYSEPEWSWRVVDRICCRLGTHPMMIYGDMWIEADEPQSQIKRTAVA
jgi:hypothetical protein